jgi:hypothetical protein
MELNCDKLFTTKDLHEMMQDLSGAGIDVYTEKHLQQLLFE